MKIKYNFHKGACLEYMGEKTDPNVKVQFIDMATNEVKHDGIISPNMWIKPVDKHFIQWKITVRDLEDNIIWQTDLDLTGKRVIIVYPYTTLGDFLYWMPVFERFRKEHNCQLIVHCKRINYINSVCNSYPHIFFTTNYGALINESIYAIYEPEFQLYDSTFWDGTYPRYTTPQQVVSACLGLKHTPLMPMIDYDDTRPDIDGKYVCITEFGQSNYEKNWLYPNGWQAVTDFLMENGYKVVPISAEPTNIIGDNVIDRTGLSLTEAARYIKYADCVVSIATAAICIALATATPAICIITNVWIDKEFPIHYVYNHTEGTCFGCYTWKQQDGYSICDKKQHVSCAHNTVDVPECSLNIPPDMVIEKIKNVLNLL